MTHLFHAGAGSSVKHQANSETQSRPQTSQSLKDRLARQTEKKSQDFVPINAPFRAPRRNIAELVSNANQGAKIDSSGLGNSDPETIRDSVSLDCSGFFSQNTI